MHSLKTTYPLSKVYQLLEPGPVVMVSTQYKGKTDIMTMSWHMMVEFEPPLIACVISNRNFSFEQLRKSKECVINIPSVDLIEKTVAVGNCTGAHLDKFSTFKLTPEIGSLVEAPLIGECFANLECKIVDTRMVSQYNIFILEVLKAWMTKSRKRQRTFHHLGEGRFVIDGKEIKLPSKMK